MPSDFRDTIEITTFCNKSLLITICPSVNIHIVDERNGPVKLHKLTYWVFGSCPEDGLLKATPLKGSRFFFSHG